MKFEIERENRKLDLFFKHDEKKVCQDVMMLRRLIEIRLLISDICLAMSLYLQFRENHRYTCNDRYKDGSRDKELCIILRI